MPSFYTTNMNVQTGIRYGFISANSVDPDFLEAFEPVYEDVFCEKCGEKLTDIFCDMCGEKNYNYEQDAYQFEYKKNGIHAVFTPNDNTIVVLKSKAIWKRALCSPCCPNAGDLEKAGNYRTYGIPKKYLREVFRKRDL